MKTSSYNFKSWRIAVCGCGSSLSMYEGIQQAGQIFQLVAVSNPGDTKRQLAMEKWHVTKAYSESEEMFEKENLKLVVIATPPSNHLDLALKAAKRGIHLLIQKPLARSLGEAKQIIDVCQKYKVGLKVSFSRRHTPAFLEAFKLVKNLGEGYLLRITWSSSSGLRPRTSKLWKEKLDTLGGVLVDLGSHVVDVARWWMGEITDGYLAMSVARGDLDNIASFLLKHKSRNNTICSLSNMEYTPKESYEYTASLGGFTLERQSEGYPGAWKLTGWNIENTDPKIQYFDSPKTNPFIVEITNFINTLKRGDLTIDQGDLGFNALKTTTSLYRSASNNKKVNLENFSLKEFFQYHQKL